MIFIVCGVNLFYELVIIVILSYEIFVYVMKVWLVLINKVLVTLVCGVG